MNADIERCLRELENLKELPADGPHKAADVAMAELDWMREMDLIRANEKKVE